MGNSHSSLCCNQSKPIKLDKSVLEYSQIYYRNGNVFYEGKFKKYIPHDKNGRFFSENCEGRLIYQGGVKNGKKNGMGLEFYDVEEGPLLKFSGKFSGVLNMEMA